MPEEYKAAQEKGLEDTYKPHWLEQQQITVDEWIKTIPNYDEE